MNSEIDKVFVCGDIHAHIDILKLSNKNWIGHRDFLTENDLLIILGDFGLFWYQKNTKEEIYWLNWLLKKKCQVAFIDGNHENHDIIDKFPIDNKWGGRVHECYVNERGKVLYHLMRGEVYIFNKKRVAVFGGANSIDKALRKEYISWWRRELPSYEEEINLYDNVSKYDGYIDYVLTHTCPNSISVNMFGIHSDCRVAHMFDDILRILKFKEWHFAHYHKDVSSTDNKFYCHYNNSPMRII